MEKNKKTPDKFIEDKKATTSTIETLAAFAIIMIIFIFFISNLSAIYVPYDTNNYDMYSKNIALSENLIKEPGLTKYNLFDWQEESDINNKLDMLGLAKILPSMEYIDEYILNVRSLEYINYTQAETYYEIIKTKVILVPNNETTAKTIYIILPIYKNSLDNNHTFIGDARTHLIGVLSPYSILKMYPQEYITYGVVDQDKINALNKESLDYETAKESLGLGVGYDFRMTILNENDEKILDYGSEISDNSRIVSTYSRSVVIEDSPGKLIMNVFR